VAILCHRLDAISAALGATLQTVGIFAAGFAYMRLGVPVSRLVNLDTNANLPDAANAPVLAKGKTKQHEQQ
jgi:hypothetical protein